MIPDLSCVNDRSGYLTFAAAFNYLERGCKDVPLRSEQWREGLERRWNQKLCNSPQSSGHSIVEDRQNGTTLQVNVGALEGIVVSKFVSEDWNLEFQPNNQNE
jgi:hypothetical protein